MKKYLKYLIFIPNVLLLILVAYAGYVYNHTSQPDSGAGIATFAYTASLSLINTILAIIYIILGIVKKEHSIIWISIGFMIVAILFVIFG